MLAKISATTSPFGFAPCWPPWWEADAHCASFHVAAADYQHRVDAQLFRVGDLRLERRGAEIGIHTHHVRAQFGHDGLLRSVDQRFVVVERDDLAHSGSGASQSGKRCPRNAR